MPEIRRARPAVASAERRRLHALLGACAVLLLAGCQDRADYLRLSGATMGTYYQVTARCPEAATDPGERVEATLAQVNAEMSTYLADSELSRVNQASLAQWVEVSPPLLEVLRAATELGRQSGGAFDVTVGPLVDLWGFGAGSDPLDPARVPDPADLAEARGRVGMEHLMLADAPPRVRKRAAVSVDLSAIAKGHGVDRVVEALQALGCDAMLVDVGGEVRTSGSSPSGAAWRIGVEVPDPDTQGHVQRIVTLTDAALATSGDYRNFFEVDGERYSHTIDPRSGRPVSHALASVTVAHGSAMWADGWATALNVLGPDRGFELAEQAGLAALFIVRGENGFEERYTEAMAPLLGELP